MLATQECFHQILGDLPFEAKDKEKFFGEITLDYSRLMHGVAEAMGGDQAKIKYPALIVELIRFTIDLHASTIRVGRRSLEEKFAILGGDFLFAQALSYMPLLKDNRLDKLIFLKLSQTIEGGISSRKMRNAAKPPSLHHYMKYTARKSGGLLSLCFTIPAVLNDLPRRKIRRLEKAGEMIGGLMELFKEWKIFQSQHLEKKSNILSGFPLSLWRSSGKRSWIPFQQTKRPLGYHYDEINALATRYLTRVWQRYKKNLSAVTHDEARSGLLGISVDILVKHSPIALY